MFNPANRMFGGARQLLLCHGELVGYLDREPAIRDAFQMNGVGPGRERFEKYKVPIRHHRTVGARLKAEDGVLRKEDSENRGRYSILIEALDLSIINPDLQQLWIILAHGSECA